MQYTSKDLKTYKIFIVDDDKFYADLLAHHLGLDEMNLISKFNNGRDCVNNLHLIPDIICLDYSLPDLKCEHIIKNIENISPTSKIIVVSGLRDIKTATQLALRDSVYDYLVKDENTTKYLWRSVLKIKELIELKNENSLLRSEISVKYSFENSIIGQSDVIKSLFKLMDKATNSDISVSISGETGTGKELVAKAIHHNSKRKKGSFVSINVGAIPTDLIESELFGHERGSFTGAISTRKGKFEEAHKGTIFLDEIGEMDLNMQTKLLRVIQERELSRIGSNKKIKIDIRILTSTHRNLSQEVDSGNFRQDLYYRLMGIPIKLPPLRDRGSDILLLSEKFISDFCKSNNRKSLVLSKTAKDKLMKYSYPGNVRELKAIIELSVVMCDGNTINDTDINFENFDSTKNFLLEEASLESYTVDIISHFLKNNNNNAILVAKKLGVAKSTIYRMIKKHNITTD